MATLANVAKNSASLTNVAISTALSGGVIFYAWMFWFTTSAYSLPSLTNAAKSSGSISNQAKN